MQLKEYHADLLDVFVTQLVAIHSYSESYKEEGEREKREMFIYSLDHFVVIKLYFGAP